MDGVVLEDQHPIPVGLVLVAALPVTLLFRRKYPLHATLVAAAIVGLVAVVGTPLFIGTGAGAVVTLGLLSWPAGIRGDRASWLGLSLLSVATILPEAVAHPGNLPILLATFGLPAFAGHEWSARDREGRDAEARADRPQSELDARVVDAVRAERLRIAR